MSRGNPSASPGTTLQLAFSRHGITIEREQAANIADLLLSLVVRGVLVSAEDPIVNNMGSSVHRKLGDVA